MFIVVSVHRVLVMCFILSNIRNASSAPPINVKDIMPSASSSSELFGSKYQRSQERYLENQRVRAKVEEMKAKGLITPSEEFDDNPMGRTPVKSEYVSELTSDMKSVGEDNVGSGLDDMGSDLDITVEKLFATTEGKGKKAPKKGTDELEKFPKFIHDDRFGITIPNDNTVDYVGTEFGSIMELIEIKTKSRQEYFTRKQLYDSDEFRPKMTENRRKYYVMKERVLESDELNKPVEEIQRKGTTLSLLDRVNRITRAKRTKKAPYMFKRKSFGTKAEGDDEEDDSDEKATEPYYEDPALEDKDEEAERWRQFNQVANFDKVMANFMQDQEDEIKKRENEKKQQPSEEKHPTEQNSSPSTTEIILKITKTTKSPKKTKKTKATPSTKQKTTKKKKSTTKSVQEKSTLKVKPTTVITLKPSTVKISKNISVSEEVLAEINRKPRTAFIKPSIALGDNKSTIRISDVTRVTKVQNDTTSKTTMPPSDSNTSLPQKKLPTVSKNTSITKSFELNLDKNSKVALSIKPSNSSTSNTLSKTAKTTLRIKTSLSVTKTPIGELKLKPNTLRTAPTFQKVVVKTIGIRKLTTKLKKKGKATTTSKKKT